MKRTVKVMAAIMLVAAMVFSIASCGGLDMNKVKGTWIVSTINGKSPADLAAELGTVEAAVQKVWEITDKQATLSCIGGDSALWSASGNISVKSNGIEAPIDGVNYPLLYNEADKTLSYTVGEYNYVLVQGSYDVKAKFDEQVAAINSAEEAPAEDYSEDGEYYEGEEDYGEEDYYEE